MVIGAVSGPVHLIQGRGLLLLERFELHFTHSRERRLPTEPADLRPRRRCLRRRDCMLFLCHTLIHRRFRVRTQALLQVGAVLLPQAFGR